MNLCALRMRPLRPSLSPSHDAVERCLLSLAFALYSAGHSDSQKYVGDMEGIRRSTDNS